MIFFSDSPHFENWPNFQKQCSIFTSKSFRAVYFDDNIIYASKQFPLLMFGLFLTRTLNFYLLTSYGRIEIITIERIRVTFTPNGKREFVPCDQVFRLFFIYWLLLLHKNKYFLLAEFSVRTVNYGSSFFSIDLRPKREALGPSFHRLRFSF